MNFFLNNALISLNTDQTPKSILLTITRLITMRSQPTVLRLFCSVVVFVGVVDVFLLLLLSLMLMFFLLLLLSLMLMLLFKQHQRLI